MKKVIFVVIPLLMIGGVVVLARTGIVKIPGLTPAKKTKQVATKSAAKQTPAAPAAKPLPRTAANAPQTPSTTPPEQEDKTKGAAALAELWNAVDTARLKEILKDWKDPDVALVFAQMDTDKVADVLSQLDPKRASKLSQMVEKQASVVKQEAGAS